MGKIAIVAIIILVQGFTDTIKELDNNASAAIDNYNKALATNNVVNALNAAAKAMEVIEESYSKCVSMEIPNDLPSDVSDLLRDTKKSLESAYNERDTAYANAIKYLDTQQPSFKQKYQNASKSADSWHMKAATSLIQARVKVGLSQDF